MPLRRGASVLLCGQNGGSLVANPINSHRSRNRLHESPGAVVEKQHDIDQSVVPQATD